MFQKRIFEKQNNILLSSNRSTAILKTTSLTTVCCQKSWKSGTHYFSVKIEKTTNPSNIMVGLVSKKNMNTSQTYISDVISGYGYFAKDGKISEYDEAFGVKDEIGCLVDFGRGVIAFFKNGKYLGIAFKKVTGYLSPAVTLFNSGDTVTMTTKKYSPQIPKNFVKKKNFLKNGNFITLKTHLGNYLYINDQNQITTVQQLNEQCKFLVKTIENTNNLMCLKEFIHGYLLYVTNKMDVKLKIEECGNGFTIFSNGAYLGLTTDNRICLFKTKTKESIFYPTIVEKPNLEKKVNEELIEEEEISEEKKLVEKSNNDLTKLINIKTPSFENKEKMNEDLKQKLSEKKESYLKNEKMLTFNSLTKESPLKIEMDGMKISQSFNGTFSVVSDRKLKSENINYFEFQIYCINPINEWICIGVLPSFYEIPPKMLGKNLNFVGALDKEYSIGSDGQFFANGAYMNKYKKNEDFMFKTDDIISIYFHQNILAFFKNGTKLHSFDVSGTDEYYVAMTLFGLSPSIESVNPQLFSLCIPKNVLEKKVDIEPKKKPIPRPNTLIPGSIATGIIKGKTPPPIPSKLIKKKTNSYGEAGDISFTPDQHNVKKKSGSFGISNPISFDDKEKPPIGFKEGMIVTIKTGNDEYLSWNNNMLQLNKSITEYSLFEIMINGNYLQLKNNDNFLKIDNNPIIKIEKEGYGYIMSSPGFSTKYLGVSKVENTFFETKNKKHPDLIFYIEIPIDKTKQKSQSSEKLIPDDPMKSFENYFKSGNILSLKSYWGNYFYYSQNIPSISNEESRATQFIVEKMGNKYRFTNEKNIPIVCTSPNDYLFTITEHSNPEINGYSLLSDGGKYLGISQDKKILLYSTNDAKETRFYPIKYDLFFGIGPFQQGTEIYLKTIFGFYLSSDQILQSTTVKNEHCKLTVDQFCQLFKFKNSQQNYIQFSKNINDNLVYIIEYNDPQKNGYSIVSNGKYLAISQQGQIVLSNTFNAWETRFFPEVVKKEVFKAPVTLSHIPFKMNLTPVNGKSNSIISKNPSIVTPSKILQPKIEPTSSWRLNKKLLESKNWIEKTTYKILKIEPQNLEYKKITKHFDDSKFKITHAYCVYNDSLEHLFSHRLENLSIRLTKDVFKPKWENETNKETRLKTLDRMNTFVEEEYKGVKIIPIFHGCSRESVYEICETGFANLKLTDSGFFGTGFYGTTQSEYSCRVYGKGVTLLCYVSVANVYPVIDGDMKKLIGKSNYLNFDSHYVPVYPKDMTKHILGRERTYYPIKSDQKPTYDEFVVFQESQIIPRYLIYYEPK
eukprot:gene10154-2574_t